MRKERRLCSRTGGRTGTGELHLASHRKAASTAGVILNNVSRSFTRLLQAGGLPHWAQTHKRASEMPRPNAPGWLVVLEGIDGAGKSTVLQALAAHAVEAGYAPIMSSEPTRGPWGMQLRRSMIEGRLSLDEELQLFLKDRAQHVEELISPALRAGKLVLLDRYYLSTAAYQGARGGDPAEILAANEEFAPKPDLVLLLDFDPAAGLDRIRSRGDAPNTFEQLDQLRDVRQIFTSIQRDFIQVIDAAQPRDVIAVECCQAMDRVLQST